MKVHKLDDGDWFDMNDRPYMRVTIAFPGNPVIYHAVALDDGSMACPRWVDTDHNPTWWEQEVTPCEKPTWETTPSSTNRAVI